MTSPDASLPVITVTDDSLVHVRAYVEELDALRLHVGQKAEVLADGLPGQRFAGKITWIAPSMQPKSVRHQKPGEHLDVKVREVRILIEDPSRLVFGLPVEVFIAPPDKSLAAASPLKGRDQTPKEAPVSTSRSGETPPHQTPKER